MSVVMLNSFFLAILLCLLMALAFLFSSVLVG
jgi:hypothetical protein